MQTRVPSAPSGGRHDVPAAPALTLRREEFSGTADAWDRLCAGFAEFSVNQTWAWAEGRRDEGWAVRRDVWRDPEGRVVSAATVLSRRKLGVRLRYVSRGPLVLARNLEPQEAERRLTAVLAAYRRELGVGEAMVFALYQTHADIGSAALRRVGLVPLQSRSSAFGFSSVVRATGPDSLLEGASSDWRKLYRRSAQLAERIESTSDAEAYVRAREVVARIEQAKGFRTNLTPALLRSVGRLPSRLFCVREEGEIVAVLLVAAAGTRTSRLMAAVAPGLTREHPGIGRVLEVAAARWAWEVGAADYDLEGWSPFLRGVSEFKQGMRGRPFAFAGAWGFSRPALPMRLASWAMRKPWAAWGRFWRMSRGYAVQLALRGASGGAVRWETYRLYRRDFDAGWSPAPLGRHRVVLLDRFDREDFRFRLGTVHWLAESLAELEPRRRECAVLLGPDGHAVAYARVTWGRADLQELGLVEDLDPSVAYVHDVVVLPEFRGKGLAPLLLDHLCADLRRRGATAALALVHEENSASVRSFERVGFRPARKAELRRVGPWRRLAWAEAVAPAEADGTVVP
jgi:ribosomal protein S18 acetylase RimI-like enzyme